MAPLLVQLVVTVVARWFVAWRDAARIGLAVMFLFTAGSHEPRGLRHEPDIDRSSDTPECRESPVCGCDADEGAPANRRPFMRHRPIRESTVGRINVGQSQRYTSTPTVRRGIDPVSRPDNQTSDVRTAS